MKALAAPLITSIILSTWGCGSGTDTDASEATTTASSSTGGASTSTSSATAASSTGGGEMVTRTDVTLTTADGLELTGYLTAGGPAAPGAPGVVLIHQFQRDDSQWGDLPEALAAAGFRTLAFNLRGHGDSAAYAGPLTDLLTDPDGAPRDVEAALAYLADAGGADPTKLGVVGTSIGANLAVREAIEGSAATYVAFSPRLPPVEALAAQAATGMTSVFYLAGETDAGGQAADCQTMFDATGEPRAIHIYPGTPDHGIAILDNQNDARERLLDWLSTQLD